MRARTLLTAVILAGLCGFVLGAYLGVRAAGRPEIYREVLQDPEPHFRFVPRRECQRVCRAQCLGAIIKMKEN